MGDSVHHTDCFLEHMVFYQTTSVTQMLCPAKSERQYKVLSPAFWLLFWKFLFLAKYVLPSFSFPRNGYRWAMGGRVSCDTNRSNEANNIFLSESIRLGFCDRRLFFHPPRKWLSLLIDRIYSRRITLLVFTIILKFLPN